MLVLLSALARHPRAARRSSRARPRRRGASPSQPPTGTASPTAGPRAPRRPCPRRAGAGDPVLVGAGDIGDCATRRTRRRPRSWTTSRGPSSRPATTPTRRARPRASRLLRRRRGAVTGSRTRPAPGNHDWRDGPPGGLLRLLRDGGHGPDGGSWYSYDLGTWHVIVLDSECAKVGGCEPDSAQGRWLAADLAANRCVAARWRSGTTRGSAPGRARRRPSMAPFWRALYDAGVDVIVNGHDHDYERFAPQDPRWRRGPRPRASASSSSGPVARAPGFASRRAEQRAAAAGRPRRLRVDAAGRRVRLASSSRRAVDFRDLGTASCH